MFLLAEREEWARARRSRSVVWLCPCDPKALKVGQLRWVESVRTGPGHQVFSLAAGGNVRERDREKMFPIYCKKIRLSFSETWQNDTFSLTFSSWPKDLWQISFSCQCVSTQPKYDCFHSFGLILFKKLENKLLVIKLNCKLFLQMLGLMTVDTEPMCPPVLCNLVFCLCSVNRTLNYNCPSFLKFVLVRLI